MGMSAAMSYRRLLHFHDFEQTSVENTFCGIPTGPLRYLASYQVFHQKKTRQYSVPYGLSDDQAALVTEAIEKNGGLYNIDRYHIAPTDISASLTSGSSTSFEELEFLGLENAQVTFRRPASQMGGIVFELANKTFLGMKTAAVEAVMNEVCFVDISMKCSFGDVSMEGWSLAFRSSKWLAVSAINESCGVLYTCKKTESWLDVNDRIARDPLTVVSTQRFYGNKIKITLPKERLPFLCL